jgi:hypothetical protein
VAAKARLKMPENAEISAIQINACVMPKIWRPQLALAEESLSIEEEEAGGK